MLINKVLKAESNKNPRLNEYQKYGKETICLNKSGLLIVDGKNTTKCFLQTKNSLNFEKILWHYYIIIGCVSHIRV